MGQADRLRTIVSGRAISKFNFHHQGSQVKISFSQKKTFVSQIFPSERRDYFLVFFLDLAFRDVRFLAAAFLLAPFLACFFFVDLAAVCFFFLTTFAFEDFFFFLTTFAFEDCFFFFLVAFFLAVAPVFCLLFRLLFSPPNTALQLSAYFGFEPVRKIVTFKPPK